MAYHKSKLGNVRVRHNAALPFSPSTLFVIEHVFSFSSLSMDGSFSILSFFTHPYK